MSNQLRLEQDRDVVALVDCGRLTRAPLAGGTILDASLDAVVALAAVADEVGDRFGAVAFDDEVRLALPPRRRGGAHGVASLFDLEPATQDSDYAKAFARVESGKRSLVVIFTDLLEPIAARPLIEAVPVLARRHAVTVMAAADPALDGAVSGPGDGVLGAYRSAAAIDVLRARERASARLGRAGAAIVTAPPGRLAAACVASYLSQKRRARL